MSHTTPSLWSINFDRTQMTIEIGRPPVARASYGLVKDLTMLY